MVAILEREGGGGQCGFSFHNSHHLLLNRHSLSRFVVNQTGKTALLLLVEGHETTCEMLDLLTKTIKRWTRDTLIVNVQICTEVEASVAPPGLGMSVVCICETDVSQVH